ncbi:MAG TPA: 16S rRNA (guanine(527)-N(7))-methyltransferase RsmG [Thermodesulfovibrionales bacterium]|nr:16S rRNA (guanine(527)-N(7))-methyltransferase RsmG [Thermodesulfovibrionales bacterium]
MSPESLLRKGLKELSLAYSDEQIKAFITYLSELKKWSRAYNLTALKSDEEIIIKHFLDSLLYLRALPDGEITVMDVGSGAGFPGMPIKIMRPEITVYLLEPSRKKASFLIHIIKTLKIHDIEVIEKRIDEVKSLPVDVAVTRALFDIREFYKKAYPRVRDGGLFVLNKGPRVYEELKTIKGLTYEVLSLRLPYSDIRRFLVMVKKEAPGATEGDCNLLPTKRGNTKTVNICFNVECRLRKAGCLGFEGCPGFMVKASL